MKLFVYKTVKCEVINVEFLRSDLPLKNSAIMVKWKCLKLLYSSNGMCSIDSQSKKLIHFKACVCYFSLFFFKKMYFFVISNKVHWKEI